MTATVHTEYRPDIDGLRAIAVLLVVFFHADYALLPGGFVGVDVFFVISGYLITGVIVKNIGHDSFSYRDFYLRRIRRLAPAFALVLLCSLAAGYRFLLPDAFIHHTELAALSFLSIGNFYIANTTGGYFAADAESIPLLHTWSLSVEEQFYFFWPAILVFLFRRLHQEKAGWWLLVVVAVSLVFSEWYARVSPERAYYLLPARIFELLLGALIVFVGRSWIPRQQIALNAVGILGLLLIVCSAVMLSRHNVFPGINALYPCLGTALLLCSGMRANAVSRVLSIAPMVWIGKISYSLYLWHWVIFTFYRYAYGELQGVESIACILLSFLLAYLSWRFVENPVRHGSRLSFGKTASVYLLIPFTVFVLTFLFVDSREGMPFRFDNANRSLESVAHDPVSLPSNCENGRCEVLLIGDSHAQHYVEFVHALAADRNLGFEAVTRPGCMALEGVTLVTQTEKGALIFDEFQCAALEDAMFGQFDGRQFVVISSYWGLLELSSGTYYWVNSVKDAANWKEKLSVEYSKQVLEAGLRRTLRRVIDAGAIPVVMLDNLTVPTEAYQCANRKFTLDFPGDCSLPASELARQQEDIRTLFSRLQSAFPQLRLIDPNPVLCDEQRCNTLLEGFPVYSDEDHLHWYISRLMGQSYLARFGNPFEGGAD